MEIQGTITKVFNPQSGISSNGKEWKKQDFLLETDGQYPKHIFITLLNKAVDNCSVRENLKCTVSIDIDAREYKDRWFNSVTAWRVEPIDNSQQRIPQPQQSHAPIPLHAAPQASQTPVQQVQNNSDDLPF
jgi:hypothetical protein